VTKRLGVLHVQTTGLHASQDAFGLIYATGILRGRERWQDVRGFYFPTRRRLVWIYADYS